MTEQKDVQAEARKPLSYNAKVNNVALPIMLISMLPVFVGFGAFEIIDHFDVRGLREEGKELEAFMWSLATMVFVFIGVYVCTHITLYAMKHTPRMRESIMVLWEDENGEQIPEPEPKPIPKEKREALNEVSMVISILLLACVGMASGLIVAGIVKKIHDYFGYESLVEEGDMMAYAVDAMEFAIGVLALAVLWYIFYRILKSHYGAPIKPIIPDPKIRDEEIEGVEKQ